MHFLSVKIKMHSVIKIVLLLQIIFVVQTIAMSAEEEQKIIHGIMESCQDKEKASSSDMEILDKLGIPESREGKCTLACGLETIGIVSEDKDILSKMLIKFLFSAQKFYRNKFQPKAFMFVSEMIAEKDPVMLEVARKIAEQCGILEGERCELAAEFTKCSHKIFDESSVGIGGNKKEFL